VAIRHFRGKRFSGLLDALPTTAQEQARKQFLLLKADPSHPSLQFKKVGDDLWSARVSKGYRALATEVEGGYRWFWIGTHAKYDKLIG
jgi:hypothetical protein